MILVVIFSLLLLASPAEVDNLNILLPQLQKSPFTLPHQLISAESGCYHWASSVPDFVSVSLHQPKASGCSRQALISVAQIGGYSSSIYVSANEESTQSQLKIPVRIRKLNKISIFTKSRMMNIKEIQKLELYAFDVDGNTFTSLEGMRFKWTLQQDSQIIELVPLHNAHLFLPLKTRENLEKNGFQSDMIVVRALAPGNLKIIATCIESGYQFLTDEITISVHQRFELKPGPVIRMATDTSLQLKLVRPTSEEIQLPQPYYRISSCDGFTVNSTLYLSVPTRPSRCTLKVEDTRTKPAYESSVEIIVQTADELSIITSPLVIVDKESEYTVHLMKQGNILLGESNKIKILSDFQLNLRLKTLTARKKMVGSISASLGSLKKQVSINSLLPVAVILPDDYLHLPVGEYFRLRPLGGTGTYEYQINTEIATISNINVVHAIAVGDTTVTVRDRDHRANSAIFRLKVSQLVEIQSLQTQKEVNRDEWGLIYAIGRSLSHETFTQCTHSSFSLSAPSVTFDLDKKVSHSESVSYLYFHHSKLVQEAIAATSLFKGRYSEIVQNYMKYAHFGQIESQDLKHYLLGLQHFGICKVIKFKSMVALEEEVTISLEGQGGVFTRIPLRVYNLITSTIEKDGENNLFLMTPESTLQWTYTGGSYNWPNSVTNSFINGHLTQGHLLPVVKCASKQVGSESYTLKLENNQTRKLLFPTSQTASINVICKFPKKLHLKLEHGEAFDELFVEPLKDVKGQVKVSDEFNQLFFNSSNVKYEYFSKIGAITGNDKQFSYTSLKVNDTISIFTDKLTSGLSFKKVSIDLTITIVAPLVIEHPLVQPIEHYQSIMVLFTKKPFILNIKDLHSQVYIQCQKAVSCERGENYVAVKLLKVGNGSVVIKDKKIYGSQAWHFEFIIVQLDEVKISGNKDYVQQGDAIEVTLENYYKGHLISPYTYEPSSLQLMMEKSLRVLEQKINVFTVKAEEAGDYEIYGQNSYPRAKRSKDPFNLSVYKRIRTNIEEISWMEDKGFLLIEARTVILAGCRRLIRVEGGPKDISLVSKSESNIVIKPLGKRSLEISSEKEGKFQMAIAVTYKGNEISRVMASITVSKIQQIELQSIDQPVQGAHFRVHPKFKVSNSNLEESICDFEYNWGVSNGNIKLGESRSFGFIDGAGVNATAINAGKDTLHLEVVSRENKAVIGSAVKNIQILQDVQILLPTYINQAYFNQSISLLMPPETRYQLNPELQVSAESGIISIWQNSNIIESGKKLGHSTITLKRNEFRPLHVEVEVKDVEGLFISNGDGYIGIDSYSFSTIPIYLQDNTGRLFVAPLQNLNLTVTSSNSDILSAQLASAKNSIELKSKGEGLCVLSLMLPNRNVADSIVVSIGSTLIPGRYAKVLTRGSIQFSSVIIGDKWTSSQPEVAVIDQKTGLLQAIKPGSTIIRYGELSSRVEVTRVVKLQQSGVEKYKGSTLQVEYKAFWQGDKGLEEISILSSLGAITNNLQAICSANSRQLTAVTSLIKQNGTERIRCSVSARQDQKLPQKLTISIKDGSNSQIGEFLYSVKPHFSIEKSVYSLSPANPSVTIKIKTQTQLNISSRNGKADWVHSKYDDSYGVQTITVDMKDHTGEVTWWLDISCVGQKQQVKLQFSKEEKSGSHSFWSFNLDWPDYLIMVMALVFGAICIIQYRQS